MLIEFKRFSDGMLSKMDEQNRLLSHLISSQRSIYTSTPAFKNANFKPEKYEINQNNDQCKIVEHNLEVPESFCGPYPNEKFEKNQFLQLENESLRFYKEQLKFWENDKALAFYFFEHRNLSAGVKAGIKTSYNKFKEKYKVFCIDNLKNYFTNLNITNKMAKSNLSLRWERIKRLTTCSFGIQMNEFPKIKFFSCKQGREENISAINKDQYLKAVNLLNEKEQYEDV